MINEMMQILASLNEEQLTYIYTYIKEYFQIDEAEIKKRTEVAKP